MTPDTIAKAPHDLSSLALHEQAVSSFKAQQQQLFASFAAQAFQVSAFFARHSLIHDQLLRKLWKLNHLARPGVALVAVGGYGRAELYPHSDVDVLVLVPENMGESLGQALGEFVRQLWDAGLKAATAIRSVEQAIELGQSDVSVATSLFEARLLAGSRQVFAQLHQQRQEKLANRLFLRLKLSERDERHRHFSDTPYSLEPNLKNAPGALRDVQLLRWLLAGFAPSLKGSFRDWVRLGLSTDAEIARLQKLYRFMARLRVELHLISGRAQDQLLFEYQSQLYPRLVAHPVADARQASESLMRLYYRAARGIYQISKVLANRLMSQGEHSPTTAQSPPLEVKGDVLVLNDPTWFEQHPEQVFACFSRFVKYPQLREVSPSLVDALWRYRTHINEQFRRNKHHRRAFLALLQQGRWVARSLEVLHSCGILGRYIPAFGLVVGQLQHDLFHVYTVDAHTLLLLRYLRSMDKNPLGEHADPYHDLYRRLTRPYVVLLAGLFHDIGKGRGGDHAHVGESEIRAFCRDHDMSEEDTNDACFLVLEHLRMSQTAQKEDLSDNEVIQQFAQLVATPERLVMLYLLTVADIQATSPKVWNGWKERLLRELFHASWRYLQKDQRQSDPAHEKMALTLELLSQHGQEMKNQAQTWWARLPGSYFSHYSAQQLRRHAVEILRHPQQDMVIRAWPSSTTEAIGVMLYCLDQPLLFARVTAFFARTGYSVVEAKVHTTRDGYAIDTFMLMPTQGAASRESETLRFIEYELKERITQVTAPDQWQQRLSRRARQFPVQPIARLSVRNDQQIRLDITAGDRPGLLSTIATALASLEVDIHAARIDTLGERVEDTFLLSCDNFRHDWFRRRVEAELMTTLENSH